MRLIRLAIKMPMPTRKHLPCVAVMVAKHRQNVWQTLCLNRYYVVFRFHRNVMAIIKVVATPTRPVHACSKRTMARPSRRKAVDARIPPCC